VRHAIATNVSVAAADFAMPAMAATAHIMTIRVAKVKFQLVNNHIYVDASSTQTGAVGRRHRRSTCSRRPARASSASERKLSAANGREPH
jgi:hypothetical protein